MRDIQKDGYLLNEIGMGTADHKVYIGNELPSSPLDVATTICQHAQTLSSLVPSGMSCAISVVVGNNKGVRATAGVDLKCQT